MATQEHDKNLVSACRLGWRQRAIAELERGAKPNCDRGNPLRFAAERGNRKLVQALLEAGADPNKVVRHLPQPLSEAARQDDCAMIRLLLKHGATWKDRVLDGEENPLIEAAEAGSLAALKLLARTAGGDLTQRKDAVGALQEAVLAGQQTTARWLNDQGVRLHGAGRTQEMFSAVIEDDVERVKQALARGCPVDVRDKKADVTPIHGAASLESMRCLPVLLEHGASQEMKERKYCRTPLTLAATLGRDGSVSTLLAHGTVTRDTVFEALLAAARHGRLSVLRLLLDALPKTQVTPKLLAEVLSQTWSDPICAAELLNRGASPENEGFSHDFARSREVTTLLCATQLGKRLPKAEALQKQRETGDGWQIPLRELPRHKWRSLGKGSFGLPVCDLRRLFLVSYFLDDSVDLMLTLRFPEGVPQNVRWPGDLPRRLDCDIDLDRLRDEQNAWQIFHQDDRVILHLRWGSPWETSGRLERLGATLLSSLPSCRWELVMAHGNSTITAGNLAFAGTFAEGILRVQQTSFPAPVELLHDALELVAQEGDPSRSLLCHDAEEAETVVLQSRGNPMLSGKPAERDGARIRYAELHHGLTLISLLFRRRYGSVLDVAYQEGVEKELNDEFEKVMDPVLDMARDNAKTRSAVPRSDAVLFESYVGTYYECPIPSEDEALDKELSELGFDCLGAITGTPFPDVVTQVYASSGFRYYAVRPVSRHGDSVLDLFSLLEQGACVTTTRGPKTGGNYPEVGIYRSWHQDISAEQLIEQHTKALEERGEDGPAQITAATLEEAAAWLDDYLDRWFAAEPEGRRVLLGDG